MTETSETQRPTTKEIARADFARRLKRFMHLKGWNQTDVWRQSQRFTPEGAAGVTRDLVSKYAAAKTLPGQLNLKILADTLGCGERDLLPAGPPDAPEGNLGPALEVADHGNGTVWLRINQTVEWAKALKILAILRGEDESSRE